MALSLAYSRPSLRVLTALLLLSVCGAVGISVFDVGRSDHGLIQLVLFPIVLLLMSGLSVANVVIPRGVLVVAGVGGLCGALCTYTNVDLAPGAFVVAQLQESQSDSDIAITRDRIRRPLGGAGLVLVGSLVKQVHSDPEARDVLSQRSRLGGVVWGSARWVNVSLRVHDPVELGAISAGLLLGELNGTALGELRLITGVPSIGLSNSLDPATSAFIGRLVPLWRDLRMQLMESHEDDSLYEQRLRSLASLKSSWTSFAHRALPMWMAGTYHLARAISGSEVESGELWCAERSLVAALNQLGPTDNPALQVAIRNNLALLLVIKAGQKPTDRDSRKIAIRLLREARNVPSAVGDSSSAQDVVALNLKILKGRRAPGDQDG